MTKRYQRSAGVKILREKNMKKKILKKTNSMDKNKTKQSEFCLKKSKEKIQKKIARKNSERGGKGL